MIRLQFRQDEVNMLHRCYNAPKIIKGKAIDVRNPKGKKLKVIAQMSTRYRDCTFTAKLNNKNVTCNFFDGVWRIVY